MTVLEELILSQEAAIKEGERRLAQLKELQKREKENAWVSAKDAAEQLGVSVRTIPVWCMDGRLEGRNPGKRWKVSQASIEKYLGGTQ